MNKHFGKIAITLGAAALFSFHAQAAGVAAGTTADAWPVEAPASVYFGDTDSSAGAARSPDVAATVSFANPADQDGPVVLARSSIVDTQRLEAGEPAATMLAHNGQGGSAAGMH